MKRSLIFLIGLITCFLPVTAQDIEVKKFVPLAKDQTAVTNPRKDINGNECALVKVALKEAGAEFEGNVMGDVQYTGSEYLVYLPKGTKRLGIKHPDYLPTTVVFGDYGTKKVESSTTYGLSVKANKKKAKVDNSKKGMAVFNIKPTNALLLINGQVADGSGGAYTLSLPYGTHYFTVKLNDFSINNQVVQIDKNAKNINVDLTEYFAKVSINCPTEDAELSINSEQKGVGKWEGMMIPGKYTIEASKDGCHSQSRQIELKDNDEITVDFTNLKTITGSLRVDYEPAGADVLLNGKKVGVTPLVLKELPVGSYQLEIWKEYYVKEFATVKIAEDQEWKESGKLKLTQFGYLVQLANAGSPIHLADYYRLGFACRLPAYRDYSCSDDSIHVSIDPIKSVYWYRKEYQVWSYRYGQAGDFFEKMGWDREVAEAMFGDSCYSIAEDEKLSYIDVKYQCFLDKAESEWEKPKPLIFYRTPLFALAWHLYHGIGCNKNIELAKRIIRWACSEDGEYKYPAYTQLIKEMGMDRELRYNPNLDNHD